MASTTLEAVAGSRRGATTFWRVANVARLAGVGVWAGALAGLVAGGIGSRVVMRIVALMAGHEHYGELTEAEEVVGQITAGGTVALLVGGIILGMLGGVLYIALGWWLRGFGRWKGLVYGALLLAAFGAITLDRNNFDFTTFGSPTVTMLMIATLYLAFGLLVTPLADRLERATPTTPPFGPVRLRSILGYLLVLPIGALIIVMATVSLLEPIVNEPLFVFVPAYLIAAVAIVRWAIRSGEERRVTLTGIAVLALPVLAGGAFTLYNVGTIVRDGYF